MYTLCLIKSDNPDKVILNDISIQIKEDINLLNFKTGFIYHNTFKNHDIILSYALKYAELLYQLPDVCFYSGGYYSMKLLTMRLSDNKQENDEAFERLKRTLLADTEVNEVILILNIRLEKNGFFEAIVVTVDEDSNEYIRNLAKIEYRKYMMDSILKNM